MKQLLFIALTATVSLSAGAPVYAQAANWHPEASPLMVGAGTSAAATGVAPAAAATDATREAPGTLAWIPPRAPFRLTGLESVAREYPEYATGSAAVQYRLGWHHKKSPFSVSE